MRNEWLYFASKGLCIIEVSRYLAQGPVNEHCIVFIAEKLWITINSGWDTINSLNKGVECWIKKLSMLRRFVLAKKYFHVLRDWKKTVNVNYVCKMYGEQFLWKSPREMAKCSDESKEIISISICPYKGDNVDWILT